MLRAARQQPVLTRSTERRSVGRERIKIGAENGHDPPGSDQNFPRRPPPPGKTGSTPTSPSGPSIRCQSARACDGLPRGGQACSCRAQRYRYTHRARCSVLPRRGSAKGVSPIDPGGEAVIGTGSAGELRRTRRISRAATSRWCRTWPSDWHCPRSIGARRAEDRPGRPGEDHQVTDHGPVVDVVEVEADGVFPREVGAS